MADKRKRYFKVGSYTEGTATAEPKIEREYFGQGDIFKDEKAFLKYKKKVCYIPELSDTTYTRQSFLDLCGGNEDLAAEAFDTVDWQHPETWAEEQFQHGEWDACEKCGWVFNCYRYDNEPPITHCPHCDAELSKEDK